MSVRLFVCPWRGRAAEGHREAGQEGEGQWEGGISICLKRGGEGRGGWTGRKGGGGAMRRRVSQTECLGGDTFSRATQGHPARTFIKYTNTYNTFEDSKGVGQQNVP